jgi:CheY-like chemotaxis protein
MATVMVVDDDPEFLQTTERSMAAIGHKALLAVSGNQAKMLLAMLAEQIDLALVDLVMRAESGLDVIRDLKRSRPDLKVIAMTLHATETDLEIARYLGAEAALRKPVSEEWKVTITDVLEGRIVNTPSEK